MKKECEKIRVKWHRKQRRLDLFLKDNEQWLNEDLTFTMLVSAENSWIPSTSSGRRQKTFVESSQKWKKRKVQHLLNDYSKDQVAFAAQLSVRASGKRDAATLIEELSTASPKRATTYKKARKIINTKREHNILLKKLWPFSYQTISLSRHIKSLHNIIKKTTSETNI